MGLKEFISFVSWFDRAPCRARIGGGRHTPELPIPPLSEAGHRAATDRVCHPPGLLKDLLHSPIRRASASAGPSSMLHPRSSHVQVSSLSCTDAFYFTPLAALRVHRNNRSN